MNFGEHWQTLAVYIRKERKKRRKKERKKKK
jgi:hypothetical protein